VLSDLEDRCGRLLVAETEDSPPYEAARAFYEARGFRRAAEIADFYRPGVAKIFYVKALGKEGGQ
jgi:ribosomal protein S18 acetylase RimI-like enzyme